VTDTAHHALLSSGLHAVQIWSKSVSKDGRFVTETQTVSRPYVAFHCSGVTEITNLILPTHPVQTVQVWTKSGIKEGHFNLEAEAVFLPYLTSHCIGVTETSYLELPTDALKYCKFGRNRSVIKATLLLR
jgi:hypothetical protein